LRKSKKEQIEKKRNRGRKQNIWTKISFRKIINKKVEKRQKEQIEKKEKKGDKI